MQHGEVVTRNGCYSTSKCNKTYSDYTLCTENKWFTEIGRAGWE